MSLLNLDWFEIMSTIWEHSWFQHDSDNDVSIAEGLNSSMWHWLAGQRRASTWWLVTWWELQLQWAIFTATPWCVNPSTKWMWVPWWWWCWWWPSLVLAIMFTFTETPHSSICYRWEWWRKDLRSIMWTCSTLAQSLQLLCLPKVYVHPWCLSKSTRWLGERFLFHIYGDVHLLGYVQVFVLLMQDKDWQGTIVLWLEDNYLPIYSCYIWFKRK